MLSLWATDAQIWNKIPLTVYLHTLKPDRLIQGNAQNSENVVGNCECVCWEVGRGEGGGWYNVPNWKQMSCFLIVVPRNRHQAFDKELHWPQGWVGWMLQLGSVGWSKCCFHGPDWNHEIQLLSCQERRMGWVLLLIAVTGTTGEGARLGGVKIAGSVVCCFKEGRVAKHV